MLTADGFLEADDFVFTSVGSSSFPVGTPSSNTLLFLDTLRECLAFSARGGAQIGDSFPHAVACVSDSQWWRGTGILLELVQIPVAQLLGILARGRSRTDLVR